MTEFGKRNGAGGARAHGEAAATPADLAAAVAAVKTGKLPFWAQFGPLRLVFFLVAAVGLVWGLIHTYAGDIVRDHRLAGTWQPAYDARVVDPKCKRYNFIITFCDAEITSLAEPDQAAREINYMMMFSSGGGEILVPVRSTVDPSAVSVGYAAETLLTNRTLSLVVLAFGFAASALACVRALLRGRYKGGAAHRALLAGLAELKARVETAQAHPSAGA